MADINDMLPTVPVGLFEADQEGRVTAANSGFAALVHGNGGSALGSAPWANAHPGDRASSELEWRRRMRVPGGKATGAIEDSRNDSHTRLACAKTACSHQRR